MFKSLALALVEAWKQGLSYYVTEPNFITFHDLLSLNTDFCIMNTAYNS